MKLNPIPMIAALLLLSLSLSAQVLKNSPDDDSRFKLLLKSGSFIPEKNIALDKLDQFNRKSFREQGKTFAIIQFETIPTEYERNKLEEAGIELLEYIPNNAYTVTITGNIDATSLMQLKARAIVELTPEQKMQPELAKGIFPAWDVKTVGTVDVWISFPKTFSYEMISEELQRRNFDIISNINKDYRIVALRISSGRLNELASLPFIEYIEPAPHENQPLNNKSTVNARANVLRSILPGGRNLRGEGVVIGIGDNGDPLRHIDISKRFINRFSPDYQSHGVHVQGIAAGAGNLSEKFAGYAPKSIIVVQSFSNILAYAPEYVKDYGMVITNNSYGNVADDCSTFGVYTFYSRIMDQQSFDMPQLQTVFAAGNSGGLTCSPYPTGFKTVFGDYQAAKNIITVGNTDETGLIFSGSSKGPAKDGRIKPEITTQGRFIVSTYPTNIYGVSSGTSMSSPAVAGGLALLYQRYRQLHSNANPKNALMKALICNGATDPGNNGPDYSYGFGWMNLLRSVKMLEQNNYMNDSVANSAINNHSIVVPANTALLKVMLYWNDPAASILSTKTLVNDLDLEVLNPSSSLYLPAKLDTIPANVNNAATTGADHINNIEQVVINNPSAGIYTLKVKGTTVTQNPKQEYFLVYDTIPVSTTLTYPIGGEHLLPNDSIYISWDSYGNPANTFTIEYSKNNGATWSIINNNVAANLRQFKWFVPSGDTTDQAKIRITRNGTGIVSTSEAFIVIGAPQIMASATQCEGYFSVYWNNIPKATDYEVMMLKDDEMASVAFTTDTAYTFTGLSKDSVYWVTVRPRINGIPGRRADAISRQPNTGNCSGAISNNDLKIDDIISPASSGRRFTGSALTNNIPVTVRIKNLDDVTTTSDLTVSYSINGSAPVSETIPNPSIVAGGTLLHTFATTLNMAAVGSYQLKVSVSYPGDGVVQNDTLTRLYKQLDNPAIDLASYFVDDIETAPIQATTGKQMGLQGLDRYDFIGSSVSGRISTFINSGIAYSGTKALSLDADRYISVGNTDSLTATFNLAAYDTANDNIRLDFRYKNHGQNSHAANKVWIRGDDQQNWIQVYDLYANQNEADGTYKLTSSIELTDSLAAHLQNLSSSFQVRWGQWGKTLISGNEIGAGYTFDDIRLYKVTDDVQVLSIDSPIASSCGLNAMTPVKITVHNSSKNNINSIPVVLKVDGIVIATETISSIAGRSTIQYTFSSLANLASFGSHTINAWVDLNTDTYHLNDSATAVINNLSVINSFPYLEDFEAGNGNWFSGGNENSWEYGTPISSKINCAASGSKAWKTRLSGNYNDLEKSYLYSPCFNVSGMSAPTLSLSIALDLEDCGSTPCDGAYFEYSADGKTWNRLGNYNQAGSTNWYNKNYNSNNQWSIQDYSRWHVVTIPLPNGLTQLRLRIVLSSDPSVNREGIAVDDIHIYDNVKGIYTRATLSTPINQNISAGSNWVDFSSGGKLIASIKSPTQSMGSTNVQAYVHGGAIRNKNGQYYLDRSITIKPQSETVSDSATVRFYFLDSEAESLINATGCSGCSKPAMAYELGVSKYSDPFDSLENGTIDDDHLETWMFINSSKLKIVPFDKGYYSEFKVKDFSEFWLNSGGFDKNQPLPIQLINFKATKKSNNDDVLVEWATASEFNVNHFEVEVAKGNTAYQQNQFVKIGEINSLGNSTQQQQYGFVDQENNKLETRYYRLKIVDNNGSFSYSNVLPVIFNQEILWQIYPNPSLDIFKLSYQESDGKVIVAKVYDINGKMIRQYSSVANGFVQKMNIDLHEPHFAPGLYLLEVVTGDKKQSFKLLKQ